MFKNIGGKIKIYAIVIFIISALIGIGFCITSISVSSSMFFDDKETGIVIGVLAIIVFLILGYGELIESTMQIRDKLCGTSTSYTSSSMGGGYTSTPPTGRYSAPTSSSGHSGGGKSFGARRSL